MPLNEVPKASHNKNLPLSQGHFDHVSRADASTQNQDSFNQKSALH